MRDRRSGDVKNGVSRKGPGFAANPCRDPGSATVPLTSLGVPPALPVPIRFPVFLPEEDGETPSSATGTVALPVGHGGVCADALATLEPVLEEIAMPAWMGDTWRDHLI
jgi:hypothetical protein